MSIVLRDLTKRIGEALVVSEVSLEIHDGELFVLLGASGSGKSTLLRLIAGLAAPDAGRIELHGRDVTQAPPQARGTGFVFQSYSIFRHMTAADNIGFGLRIRRVPQQARRERVSELLDLVGLAGLGDRYPDQLSGGQRQRVALARALAYRPEVLLLDEPFGALDVKIRAQLRESLKDIQRELGVTTVLVTHDQEEAFELADRIGVIDHGHVLEVGAPEDLYHRPQTEFVAAFIGGGNVVVGRVDGGYIRLGGVRLPLPPGAPEHEEGAPIRLLFRPESVELDPPSAAPPSDPLDLGPGRVVRRVFTGSSQRVRIELESLKGARSVAPPPQYGQGAVQVEALLPRRAPATVHTDPGDALRVRLSGYHVLSPTGLKVLICADETPAGRAAVEFGLNLARAAGGPTALLATAERAEESDRKLAWLEDLLRADGATPDPRLGTKVRQGGRAHEIVLEAQEGSFEVVVTAREEGPQAAGAAAGSTLRQLLEQAEIPVLLVDQARPRVERILICTAAGEPGKTDVLFGGRIARQTGARAALFHVRSALADPYLQARAERHLNRGREMLAGMGVECEVKVEQGPVVPVVLREAEAGDYDLIVLGAPAPQARQRLLWTNMATPILRGTGRPVLLVPMRK